MIKLYLLLIDSLIPSLVGMSIILISGMSHSMNEYLYGYIILSVSIISISHIKGFYDNYFLIHFSDKIKISFITSIIGIFCQIIFYLNYQIELNIFILFSFLIIPPSILLTKYVIKVKNKPINEVKISIIGNFYKFNKYENETLINKGFELHYYDSIDEFLNKNQKEQQSDNIVVINLDKSTPNINQIVSLMNTVSLNEFMKNYLRKIYIEDFEVISNINTYNKSDYLLKRSVDYISIIILFPFLILGSAFLIYMKFLKGLNGSFLYTQKRYGINQKTFSLLKLRTMHTDSDNMGNTVKNDNRVYSFAKNLRKLRIDELPQIINILLGDMHLVGPRAEWTKLSDEYSKNIENYNLRNIVRPGITGWAQIIYQYGFNTDDAEQKLMYELYYIKNWSIWLEIEICVKTIMVILDKKGF